MKLTKLGVLSAAALLAGGLSIAVAAPPSPSTSSSPSAAPTNKNSSAPGNSMASQGKCWDAATNTVKDKSTQTASGAKTSGGVTTGTGSSGNAANSTGSKLQTKPAGMSNC